MVVVLKSVYDTNRRCFCSGACPVFYSQPVPPALLCAVISGVIAIILLEIGLNLGWVYLVMGIIIGSAVFPLAACITWKKCSAVAAVTSSLVRPCCSTTSCKKRFLRFTMPFGLVSLGSSVCCVQLQQRLPASHAMTQPAHNQEAANQHPVPSSTSLTRLCLLCCGVLQVGMPCAIITWLVTAATLNDGVVDLNTTAQDYPMLAGNLVALFFSTIVCVVLTFIFPQVGQLGMQGCCMKVLLGWPCILQLYWLEQRALSSVIA
jgi:hypothetical protein